MKYNWFEFTGWVNMIRPYILPFWVVLTYIYTLIITKIVLVVCKVTREGCFFFKLFFSVALISCCVFILECVFSHIFATLMRYNDGTYTEILGLSIYENMVYFTFTLISVCFCAYVCYKLNMRFSLHHIATTGGNRELAILLMSLLTSPLVFFIPINEIIYSSITW